MTIEPGGPAFESTWESIRKLGSGGECEFRDPNTRFSTVVTVHFNGSASGHRHGVYVVRGRNNQAVYIGKAGTVRNDGTFKNHDLPGRLKATRGTKSADLGGCGERRARGRAPAEARREQGDVRAARLSRTAYYLPPLPASRRDAAVSAALTDAVTRYPRWGVWKLYYRLRAEGHGWNHKRVHRVDCALRLNLPRRTTRRVPKRIRQPLSAPPVLNQTWALDVMTETLSDSRRVRLLTILDEGNREGLEIAQGVSLPSRRVVRVLNELVAVHGRPSAVRVDNGPEFTAQPTPTSSNRLVSCARSSTSGCACTTRSGRTIASAGCRPSHSCRGLHQPVSLLSNCPLDREAYEPANGADAPLTRPGPRAKIDVAVGRAQALVCVLCALLASLAGLVERAQLEPGNPNDGVA